MDEWTPDALAAEHDRRQAAESRGICPDSGYTIRWCWQSDLCDCAYAPQCRLAVWDMADHNRREH